MSEAISFESRRHGWLFQQGVVAFLGFRRRDVADGLQKAAIIEPVDPFQRRKLDRLEVPPGPASMDDLCLVETVDRFGECVVVGTKPAWAVRLTRQPTMRRA